MSFDQASNLEEYTTMTFDGNFLMMVPDDRGSFSINDIDLTDIGSVSIISGLQEPLSGKISFELRLNSPDGEKIGEAAYEPGEEFQTPQGFLGYNLTFSLSSLVENGKNDLYVVSQREEGAGGTFILSNIQFNAAQ